MSDCRTINPSHRHEVPMETQPARIAYIHNIHARTVQETLYAPKVVEATRTSSHLRTMTERVQDVLARYGRDVVDPSDPEGRSYYDTARGRMRALLPGVDCPAKTPREGMSYLYHNSLYPFDVDIGVDPAQLTVIRDALAVWTHTTIVARSVSHEALWVVAHGPKADSQDEFRALPEGADRTAPGHRPSSCGGRTARSGPAPVLALGPGGHHGSGRAGRPAATASPRRGQRCGRPADRARRRFHRTGTCPVCP